MAIYPGLLAAGTIALAASWLSAKYDAPVMLFALLLGMAFNFLSDDSPCVAGLEFAASAVLKLGVALLGLRIASEQLLGLGLVPIAIVLTAVVTTIGIGMLAARLLRLPTAFGILSGGAVAICGASAALAISSVLPRSERLERDTILTVVVVTTLSTIAMVLYPLLANAFGMDEQAAGILLGGAIHDVAQVVGAGYTISEDTGDIATYVKLLRVAMLLPVVLLIAFLVSQRAKASGAAQAGVPYFLFAFAALVFVNSAFSIPDGVTALVSDTSRWLLVTAIAALGAKTSLKQIFQVGWRPVALVLAETAWVFMVVIAGIVLVY